MNKPLTIIAFILFSTLSFAQIVNIPNSSFRNTLLNSNCVDIDGDYQGDIPADLNNDGQIQVSEAEAVIGLIVNDRNISSLQGIQSFTNLEFLYCSDNPLSTIDLSQNIDLVTLWCFRTNLTQIDVSDSPNLENYRVFNNSISTVDLSQNPNLEYIDLTGNNLGVLDISQNVALRILDCPANNLTSLDLSANINLESIWCSGNPLNNLDTSHNINLKSLSCAYTPIINFDLSQNINLEFLSIFSSGLTSIDVSQNPSLTFIDVNHNNISTLDTSQNPILNTLLADNNQLVSLNLQNNPLMDWITVVDNNIEVLDFSQLPYLRYIDGRLNNLQTMTVKSGNNTFLSYFNLTDNPNLLCIEVDDVNYANSQSNWFKDPIANYSEECILDISSFSPEPSILLYPIPVKEKFYIKGATAANVKIKIFSVVGTELFSKEIDGNTPVDLTNFDAGIYIVDIEQADKHYIKRIIKN